MIALYGYYRENSGVQIYTRKLLEQYEGRDDIKGVEPYRALKPRFLNQALLNPVKLRRTNSELIHITNQDDLSTYFLPKAQNLVVTVHDIFRYTRGKSIDKKRGELYLSNIEKHADKIITISKATKKSIIKNTGLDQEDIEVIYQGVDTQTFKPEGETEYSKYILHVGTEIERKNVKELIQIFSDLKKKHSDLKLVRVGQPAKQTKKEIKKQNLKIGEDIIYENNISFERLKALYTNAEKLAFPSKAEGFGRPMIESLACRTPVVAYNKEPMNEVLPQEMLANNKQEFVDKLTQKTKTDCRGIAKKYNWEKTAEQTLQIYQNLEN